MRPAFLSAAFPFGEVWNLEVWKTFLYAEDSMSLEGTISHQKYMCPLYLYNKRYLELASFMDFAGQGFWYIKWWYKDWCRVYLFQLFLFY